MPPFPSFTKTWHTGPYDRISPSRPELSVKGKNVVVTGGGTGIGKAIATAFAQAGAASVTILGRREDKLKSAIHDIEVLVGQGKDQKLQYEVVDITKRAEVTQAFDRIVKSQGGPIDICVSNAGATPKFALVKDTEQEELMRLLTTNVLVTFNTACAFMPRAAENATLINISTGLVHMVPRPGVMTHVASKAASMKLIEYIQAENPNLHVVSIQPGVVKTEATQNLSPSYPDDASLPGQFCVWLVSEEAKFLKGKYIWANWDIDELMARAEEIQSSRLLSIMLEGMPM